MAETNSRLMDPIPVKEQWKNAFSLLKLLSELDRRYLPLSIIIQFLNVSKTYILLFLSARVLNGLQAGGTVGELLRVVFLYLGVYLVVSLAASFLYRRMSVIMSRIGMEYDLLVARKKMSIDYSVLESPEYSDLNRRIEEDNNWGSGIYSAYYSWLPLAEQFFSVLFGIITAFPVLIELFRNRNLPAGLAMAVLIVQLVIFSRLSRTAEKKRLEWMLNRPWMAEGIQAAENNFYGYEFANHEGIDYQNGKDYRIFHAYKLFEKYTRGRGEAHRNKWLPKMTRLEKRENVAKSLSSHITRSLSFLVVTLLAAGGRLLVGNVVKYAGVLYNVINGCQGMYLYGAKFAMVARKQLSTFELIRIEDEMYKGKLPVEKRRDDKYVIEFRDVSFRYPGSSTWALRHFSFQFRIGERLAIVGMNGSGKTTMIKLLCRLYDPTEGTILLNGVDIRKFDYAEYMELFAVVFQDFSLFSLSLADNVAAGREREDERIRECLIQAGFGERLGELPDGIDTLLYKNCGEEGVEISGGEAQKIAIARALYKSSPFILLDEPTAALDPLSEYEIYSRFDELVGSKTAIYISHRLSSCRFCDDIAVFHEGRMVQRGSHEELLGQAGGKYAELWGAQAQWYQ